MKLIKEFREFAIKGNAIDMAVGIVVGAAFGKIVDSLVKDILMPPLGMILGQVDFSNIFLVLYDGKVPGPYATLDAAQKAGAVTVNAGIFINVLISFLIVSMAVFLLVKAMNQVRGTAAPDTRPCPFCTSKISIKATRCPHCTSAIESMPESAPTADTQANQTTVA